VDRRLFVFMKEFKTVEEQIELLKSRGMIFENEEYAKEILLTNNYYNIINGYKNLFIIDKTDNYKNGTKFEEVYSLYDFDRQLRSIFLEYILKIENSLRTLVAYHFSKNHGNDNYLILNNFDIYNQNQNVNNELKEKRIKHIQSLIGNVNKKIANSITTTPYINHYIINYGFVPLWVLVNILSFGDICSFLKLMKQNERISISIHFNIKEYDLTSLLGILCHTRNLCAHGERLYNFIFPTNETINDSKYHSKLNIKKECTFSGKFYVQFCTLLFSLFCTFL